MTVITFSYLCKYSKSIKMSIVIERAQKILNLSYTAQWA